MSVNAPSAADLAAIARAEARRRGPLALLHALFFAIVARLFARLDRLLVLHAAGRLSRPAPRRPAAPAERPRRAGPARRTRKAGAARKRRGGKRKARESLSAPVRLHVHWPLLPPAAVLTRALRVAAAGPPPPKRTGALRALSPARVQFVP